jgi:hypothetical protein
MPPRHLSLILCLFWLAMAVWLCQRDLRPRLRADEPAPFVVTLVDEPRINLIPRVGVETHWALYRNSKEGKREADAARTRIDFTAGDDALEFHGEFKLSEPAKNPLVRITSRCRVDWDGNLLGISALVETRELGPRGDMEDALVFAAPVERECLLPRWYLPSVARLGASVPLSLRGSMLVLTHPMNRLPGLRVGQRWHLPQIDLLPPLESAVPAAEASFWGFFAVPEVMGPFLDASLLFGRTLEFTPRTAIDTVEAHVGTDVLSWRSRGEVPCFVIDYHGDDRTRARTWVRQRDGLVLQQEFTHAGTRYVLERESER